MAVSIDSLESGVWSLDRSKFYAQVEIESDGLYCKHDQTYLGRRTLRTTFNMDRLIRDRLFVIVTRTRELSSSLPFERKREKDKKFVLLFEETWHHSPQKFSKRLDKITKSDLKIFYYYTWCTAVLHGLFHWQASTTRCQWLKLERISVVQVHCMSPYRMKNPWRLFLIKRTININISIWFENDWYKN